MLTESLRLQAVQSPIIPIVADLIRQSPGTISLGQGVVSYGPPPEAIARLTQCVTQPDNHKYQSVRGIPALLQAIETKLKTENGIYLGAERAAVVTAGSNMGFLNALLAIADPGDEIILQTPYYFNHEMAIRIANCHPVLVATDAHYQLQPEAIQQAITPRTKAVVTISPNNPTGAMYPEAALREVNQICRRHGIYHISDEAYEYFTYGTPHFSPGSIPDSSNHTIALYSLSKAYGFASWRIGYMVIPAHLMAAVMKIQDTNLICAPVVSQYAALGALQAGVGYCREKLGAIAPIRRTVLTELEALGPLCTIPSPDGAFYCLLKVHLPLDSYTVVQRLIQDHKVAVIPGITFGLDQGCYLRVAYGALEASTVAEGIGRL